jgi:hypothetical protein
MFNTFTKLDRLISEYRANEFNNHPAFIERNGLKDIIDAISEELVVVLPHGSGIDCDWTIEHTYALRFTCNNSFHAMDNNGFYCGYVDFQVTLDLEKQSFDVSVSKEDIQAISKDYEVDSSEAGGDEDDLYDDNPAPYLDDIDDILYETVRYAIEGYYITNTITYFVKDGYIRELVKRAIEEVDSQVYKRSVV